MTNALAEQKNYYISGGLGASIIDDIKAKYSDSEKNKINANYSTDTAFTAAIEVGVKDIYVEGLRLGLSYDYIKVKGDVSSITGNVGGETISEGVINAIKKSEAASLDKNQGLLLANIYYDFTVDFPIKPYLGVGLGITTQGTDFAWAIIAGADYWISDQLSIGLKYKFYEVGIDDEDLNLNSFKANISFDDSKTHSLLLNLSYHF